MSPLIILVTLVLTPSWTTVVEGMKTHHLYAAIGSSVFFPGENLDKYTFYDFRKAESPFIVTCHDGCSVQGLYDKRGQFFQSNGTFRLNDLRVEDSGIYEYEMNFTVKGRSHLQVIAPVVVPVLLKPELRDDHMFVFTCQAQGDGPFNFTLLRNNERLRNAVTNDISSSWYMNGLDPATYGSFYCDVANPVSSKTSPSIELPPPAPVMEPVLLKQEVIENGSQCLVTFTSRVEGDGPFNFTLLRNDNEIIQNVISLNNSIPWSMDDWHPKTSGRFSFIVANAVISQTSPAILLLPPVTLKEMIIRLIVIAFLCHWISDVCLWISGVCLLCMKYICRKLRKEKKEEKDNNNEDETLQSNAHQHHGPEIRDIMNGANNSHSICLLSEWRCQNQTCSTVNKDRILSLVSRTFTIADIILGFLKEISLLLICVDGQIIPVGFCCVPGIFLLCRVIYWIFFFVNRSRETNVRFSSVVEIPTIISNMIAIPAFCIATLVIIHIRYRPPCGMMDLSPVVLLAVCALIFIFYLGIKPKVEAKRKPYTQRTEGQPESQQLVNVLNGVRGPPEIIADLGRPETNGDIGQPEDNRKPNCQGPVPPGILGNPNVGEASMQSAVFNEGDPEDQVISKPKDGQPKVAEKVPNNSHVGAGQCLPTIELEVVVDKGPVSNG